jgi:acetoacetate decarboxylase
MPDSPGFGEYTETGIVIPCLYKKQPVNYTAQMYIESDPIIATGCEIWGFTTNKKCTKPPDNCFYNKKATIILTRNLMEDFPRMNQI